MGPLVHPTNRNRFTACPSVRPSVRPERFPGICRRMHGGISLKFYMLMYLDHLQNWLVYGHGLLIFLILVLFWLSETGQIWGYRAFPGERMEGMAWNFARWCILSTLSWLVYGLGLWIFIIFTFWLSETGQIWGFGSGSRSGSDGLMTFAILALFWLSEMGQIWGFRAFPAECMEGMAWNMVRCCILTPFRTD